MCRRLLLCLFLLPALAQGQTLVPVAKAWAQNSINAVVFRRNSLVTHNNTQYIAFYNQQGKLVLGKRKIGSTQWELKETPYSGNIRDAHNSISIMVDGKGYLHISWDHHNQQLNYCKSIAPGSLELTAKIPMTGSHENKVTYPEFYRLPNGNLLFFYRDGASGNGNLMLNRYEVKTGKWEQVQNGWISGEGQRNAYWQVTTDALGTIHISWVWRETGDVATNHDMGYARSRDGGKTWEKSTGEKYSLPITEATAEYACRIPQKSELINSTSMSADDAGHPYIVTYWREEGATIPQYHLVYNDGKTWHVKQLSDRKTPFSLSGGGTKRIPISRPQIVVQSGKGISRAVVIYRDEERGAVVTASICNDLAKNVWTVKDLTTETVGQWEPSYDTELWLKKKVLHLFVERVEQGDGETTNKLEPQEVRVLEWKPWTR
jgi:hypothetical protein